MLTSKAFGSLVAVVAFWGAIAVAEPVADPYGDVDINVVRTGKIVLDVGGMGQLLGLAQSVDDPYTNQDRFYLFMPKARLRLDGSYGGRVSFNFQMAMGGEDATTTSDVTIGLLDLAFNISLTSDGRTYLKIGQFLVPYGREQLTDPGFQDFGDVSMESIGFVVGRDVGLAVVSRPGPLTLIGGIFTGGGRDIPPDHYLPERLGCPELVARIGVGDLDGDPFYLRQSELHPDGFKYQIAVNGLFMRDSTLGHSTILNIKSVDNSLLINTNWNPYLAEGGVGKFSQGDYWQAGGDAAVHMSLGGQWALAGEAQVDFAGYSNGYGSLSIWGLRAQAALLRDPFELALRYDVLGPDSNFSNSGVQITNGDPIHEIAPGVGWLPFGQNLKVLLDFPILIDVPVFLEPNVGSYVGTELPNQATVLAAKTGGTVDRQTVPQVRVMLQGQF